MTDRSSKFFETDDDYFPENTDYYAHGAAVVHKGDWDESSHERDDHGRFGSGDGALHSTARSNGWTAAQVKAEGVHPEIAKVMSPQQVDHLREVVAKGGTQEQVLKAMDPIYNNAALAAPQTMPLDADGKPPAGFFDDRLYNVGDKQVPIEPAIDHLVKGAEDFSSAKDQPSAMRYEKQAFIILGPAAAGKSGLAEAIAIHTGSAIVDSDEAKKITLEYNGGLGANATHEESSVMAQMVEHDLVDRGANVIVPTVGASEKGPLARIERFQKAGYKVTLVNAYVTKDIATQRMAMRAIGAGRAIGADYVREVGDNPSKTYESLKYRADSFMRIDGNGAQYHERITEIHNVQGYTVGGTLGGKHH